MPFGLPSCFCAGDASRRWLSPGTATDMLIDLWTRKIRELPDRVVDRPSTVSVNSLHISRAASLSLIG